MIFQFSFDVPFSGDPLANVEGVQKFFDIKRRLGIRKMPATSNDFDEPLFVSGDVFDIGLSEVGPPFFQFVEKNVPLPL